MTTPEGRRKRSESLRRRLLSKEGQDVRTNNRDLNTDETSQNVYHNNSEDELSQVMVAQRSFENAVTSSIPVLWENDLCLASDVVNLSSVRLGKQELATLDSCTKFRQNPKRLPYIQLIAGVECVARQLDNWEGDSGTDFRALCADVIPKAPNPPPNVPDQLTGILKKIGKNEELIVTASDKGGKLVVLNSTQYASMCIKHLEDVAYERVYTMGTGRSQVQIDDSDNSLFSSDFQKLDISDRLIKRQCRDLTNLLSQLKKNRDIGEQERKSLIPSQPYSGVLPKFYGLPKLHKVGELMLRPIISNRGLYSDKVMVRIKEVLNLLIWGSTSLSNSYEFAELLQQFVFEPTDILASFDVSSLFTQVPVEETLLIVERRLEDMRKLKSDPIREVTTLTNRGIMKLLRLVLKECFFSWDGLLYKQSSGLPMGVGCHQF